MKISAAGLELLKGHEGLRLKAYLDTGDVPTIGYGHTRGVKMGDTCTKEQALQWLDEDADIAENDVNRLVKAPFGLNQNQFDALVSFVYNIGGDEFSTSTLLRKLNAGDYTGAAKQFGRWIYDNGKIVNGLVLRRADERELFLREI
jgi:lysozyme